MTKYWLSVWSCLIVFFTLAGAFEGAYAQTTPIASSRPPVKPIDSIAKAILRGTAAMQARSAKQCLGLQNIEFFKSASQVQVFQIREGYYPADNALPHLGYASYVIQTTGPEQGKAFAAQLASALTDDSIYRSGGSLCFSPHIAFRVWNGTTYKDVLICFHCGNLAIQRPDGTEITGASTGNSRHPSFVDLAKKAFPRDPKIQSLSSVIAQAPARSKSIIP